MLGVRQNTSFVDCGATAHIVNDKSRFTNFDKSFCSDKHYIKLANGTKQNNVAIAKGDITVPLLCDAQSLTYLCT